MVVLTLFWRVRVCDFTAVHRVLNFESTFEISLLTRTLPSSLDLRGEPFRRLRVEMI